MEEEGTFQSGGGKAIRDPVWEGKGAMRVSWSEREVEAEEGPEQ